LEAALAIHLFLIRDPCHKTAAEQLGVCAATAGAWRNHFVARRLEGMADEPRPGAPRTVTDEDVERAVTKTAENQAGTRDPLRHARPVALHRRAHLACVRPQAAPGRYIQALGRPLLREEGQGRDRAVSAPAR
jgi:hypothetical protein